MRRVLPPEYMVGPIGEAILKPDYRDLDLFTPEESAKIVAGMEKYAGGDIRDFDFLTEKVDVLGDSKVLTPRMPHLLSDLGVSELLTGLADRKINIEQVDVEDKRFKRLSGLLVELDNFLRSSGGRGDLRDELSGLSLEDLKEIARIELVGADEQAGRLNFQDPERGAQDVREAIEKWRARKNLHRVVTIPADYYQAESGLPGGQLIVPDDMFVPGTRVIKPNLLDRPVIVRQVNGGGFAVVPMAERPLVNIKDDKLGYRRVVERFQVIEFVKRLAHGEGDEQQFLRVLQLAFKAEGLDQGTLIKAYLPGMKKAIEFYDYATKATEKDDIRGAKQFVMSPIEQASLLAVPESTLLFDFGKDKAGNERLAPFYIGVNRVVDSLWGDYGRWKKQEGEWLFIHPYSPNEPKVLSAFRPELRGMLRPVYVPEEDPMRIGRTIAAQEMYTMQPMMREELGGISWYEQTTNEMKAFVAERNWSFDELVGIRGVLFDNGRPLVISSKKIQEKIAEAGGNVSAGIEMMLQTPMFATHVEELVAGWGLSALFQRERRGDLLLASDFVSELAINMGMRDAHTKKYLLLPPETIRMVRNWHKEFEFWKKEYVDWMIIALKSKKGFRATFRNVLNPDNSPEIAPICFRNETNADGSLKSIAQKIGELESKNKIGELSDEELILWNNLKNGTTLVEALLYGRNEWGFSTVFRNMANGLVDLSNKAKEARKDGKTGKAEGLEKLARDLKVKAFKTYVLGYSDLAPNAFRRGQQQIGPLLQTVQEDQEMMEWLADFNFGPLLDSVGDQSGVKDPIGRTSLTGFSLCMKMRGSRNIMVGEVDKPGKYITKYPYVAAELGSSMLAAVPTLNNAINSMIMNLAFGKPDRLEAMSADQFGEALAKMVVDWLFVGMRSQSETSQLLKEGIEAFVDKALINTAHLSALEGEELVANTFREIHRVSQGMIDTALIYQKSFRRESVEESKVDLATKRAGVQYLSFDGNDPLAVEVIRGAGFDTNYPSEIAGKKPYVSLGDEALDLASVEVIAGFVEGGVNVKEVLRKVSSFSAYGHRGAEALTVIIMSMFARDKLLYSKEREDLLLSTLKIDRSFFERIKYIAAVKLLEIEEAEGGEVVQVSKDNEESEAPSATKENEGGEIPD
ncbi:hypothetical protein A2W24_00400 [Microgenomates group bacterium RBG_16_45_19]|nr:MAG: hypothetical protein A2W24_00400 [Microgenomates group bacterium RBG_16_45_19]